MIPILLALAAVQNSAPAGPADASGDARYRACVELVRSDPQRAADNATAWQREGGGLDARQCLGLAYVALERWAPAATVFEEAARAADAAGDSRRADLRVQAGNAWLAGGEAARAVAAFDAALATPDLTDELRGEVHVDRARAQVSLSNPAGAREDLNRALQLVPADPFAWYLSAALARRENDLPRARTDIGRAMELAPDNPDIALLAGTLAGLAGNMEEAERLYRRVAEGAPDTEAGRAARASLETLREVEVPAPASSQAPPASGQAPVPATMPPQPAPRPPQSR